MVKLTVLYGQPQNPSAFDRHYQQVQRHIFLNSSVSPTASGNDCCKQKQANGTNLAR